MPMPRRCAALRILLPGTPIALHLHHPWLDEFRVSPGHVQILSLRLPEQSGHNKPSLTAALSQYLMPSFPVILVWVARQVSRGAFLKNLD